MAIEHRIDIEQRLVVAKVHGTLTGPEVFTYQREVWSRSEVAGFDELIDMSDVEHIDLPSIDRVRQLARYSAQMDPAGPASKLAIVAPKDVAYGLGRMYETYRGLDQKSTKRISVFRSMADALAWLGVKSEPSGN